MQETDIVIFEVGLGQSIFVYPRSQPEYGMLIDCGNTSDCHPIDFLLKKNLIHNNELSNLTLTNYDHDHYSDINYLQSKVKIQTVNFAKNLTPEEIKALKTEHTEQLKAVCDIKNTYIHPAPYHNPPYKKAIFNLEKEHFEDGHDTNNLSQIVFIEHLDSVICIPGDIEIKGWKLILQHHPDIKAWLNKTNILVASHHGRENGYHPEIFDYCSPECIIISDKGIVHDTQKDMSTLYSAHVSGTGINLNSKGTLRKVLTTRNDGHLWIRISHDGTNVTRTYRTLSYE